MKWLIAIIVACIVVIAITPVENAPAMPEEMRSATQPITYVENSYDKVMFTDGDGNWYAYNDDYLIYHVIKNNPKTFPIGTEL